MDYWILHSPPGYPADRSFIVATYPASEPESGSQMIGFAASIEAARELIPNGCERVDREPFDQFVELWRTEPK